MPLTEPGVWVSHFRLFSRASLASGKRIKVVKDSRLWKWIPIQEALKGFQGEAFPLTPAIDPFEGHRLRLNIEGPHLPHVAADTKVIVVSSEFGLKHRPPDTQLGHIANGFQPQISRCQLGSEFP